MWLTVDADHDGNPDMRYTYSDSDGDGYIDVWELDVDGDGAVDDRWTSTVGCTDIAYDWGPVNAMISPVLDSAPGQLFVLVSRLREVLAAKGIGEEVPVWRLVDSGFAIETIREDFRKDYLQATNRSGFIWI